MSASSSDMCDTSPPDFTDFTFGEQLLKWPIWQNISGKATTAHF